MHNANAQKLCGLENETDRENLMNYNIGINSNYSTKRENLFQQLVRKQEEQFSSFRIQSQLTE